MDDRDDAFEADAGAAGSPTLRGGQQLGGFRILRRLGVGGYAQVWEAEDTESGRRVALKVLTQLKAASPRALKRFEREGRLAASIAHPNCVYVFSAQAAEGYPIISMELMPGGTLADRLKTGPIPAAEHARSLLERIFASEPAFDSPRALAEELRARRAQSARLSLGRRAGPMLVLASIPISLALGMGLGTSIVLREPAFFDLFMAADYFEVVDSLKATGGEADYARAEAIRLLSAAAYERLKESPFAGPLLSVMSPDTLQLLKDAFADYPSVSDSQVVEARRLILVSVPRLRKRWERWESRLSAARTLPGGVVAGFGALGYLAVPAIALSLLFRGDLLLRLFGISLQTMDGRRAGRMRAGVRSLVAWSPFWLMVLILEVRRVEFTIVVVAVMAAAFALARPQRGLPDLVAGTCLVPR